MDAGQTYRYAERILRTVSGRRLSAAGWQRYEGAVHGLRLALDTGDLAELSAVTTALATLDVPGAVDPADPGRTGQPESLRPLTTGVLTELTTLAGGSPA